MPFLHGFRRIIYEYQPLVDAVLCVVGLEEGASAVESSPKNEDRLCDSLAVLLEKESQSAVFEEGISYALFKVSERGLACAAEVLLRYGADLNFEDPVSYYTPLHIAVLRNRPNMVRMLVQHGADVDKRDRIHESSPLDLASEELERLACMHMLLDMGADVNAHDRNGKTALLHALASSDGLTVRNLDNIQLLLQKGADVHAATLDGETALSSLVFLVKEALDASAEDAAEIGRFCLRASRLLLSHGADPSCCLGAREEDGEPSLTQTSLEHFDLLFPLAVLLLQSGASFHCPRHGSPCWTGYGLLLRRLHASLEACSEVGQEAELVEQAEVLLELARASSPRLVLPACLELPEPGQDPHADSLLELHGREMELQASPAPLRGLCRAYIRGRLQPRALEERVGALPLPDRMKDFLLPKPLLCSRSGWDCFKPHSALR